jgi:integrase
MKGHIRKRGTSYQVVVYQGRGPDGKKDYYRSTHPTKRAAEETLAVVLSTVHAGGEVHRAARTRLDAFLADWLESEPVERTAPTTRAIYAYGVRHITAELGAIPLRALDARTIDQFFGRLRARGLSGATRHQVFRVLKTALGAARRWKLRPDNPAMDATPPEVPRREATIWDEEQVHIFLGQARGDTYYRLYRILLLGGLRPGEALALRWIDLSWLAGAVAVRRKFYRLGTRQVWGETKTHRQIAVALDAETLEELRGLEQEQARDKRRWGEDYRDSGLIFCQPNGEPLHEENIAGRAFKALVRKAGLPMIRLYDLRHCHATHGAAAGVPIHVMKERLGHRKVTTTLQYYTHVLPDQDRAAAETIARRLLGRDGLPGIAKGLPTRGEEG